LFYRSIVYGCPFGGLKPAVNRFAFSLTDFLSNRVQMYGLFLLNNSILQLIYCYLPKKAVHNERSAKSYFNYWMVTIQ